MTEDNCPNYYLIACGTSEYSDDYQNLPQVPRDLDRVSEVLTEQYGYQRLFKDESLNFEKQAMIDAFQEWLLSEERSPVDHVIFYFSGHGDHNSNNQHYLILNQTQRRVLSTRSSDSGLLTTDLLSLFTADDVPVGKVLFIIDTCYSGLGGGELSEYVSTQIDCIQPMDGPNLLVASITASRGSQLANEGVFSEGMTSVLQDWELPYPGDFLPLADLVERMNQAIPEDESQVIEHNVSKLSSNPIFFQKKLPHSFQTWESRRQQQVDQLITLLKKWDSSESRLSEQTGLPIFWLNTYFLQKNRRQGYLSSWTQWEKALYGLAEQSVKKGHCDLYGYGSWCIELMNCCGMALPTQLIHALEQWQSDLRTYRPQIDVDIIEKWIQTALEKWRVLLQKDEHRLLITLKPEEDEDNNLGKTENLLMTAQLWLSQDSRPLFRSICNQVLNLKPYLPKQPDPLQALCDCLTQDSQLIHLIRTTRTLFPTSIRFPSKLWVEVYLPREYFSSPLEQLQFERSEDFCSLGDDYVMTINSYSRHFDQEFMECNEDVFTKKINLWSDNGSTPIEHTALQISDHPEDEVKNYYQFDDFHIFVGSAPTPSLRLCSEMAKNG